MVPPTSHRVPRVLRYSGSGLSETVFDYVALTLFRRPSHAVRLTVFRSRCPSLTPKILLPPVWPPPRSLATTSGISVDVFSCPYLDVSVQGVPLVRLFDSQQADTVLPYRVSPFGYLRINAHLQLPEAFRSLSRPSSAPDAKAFPLRPFLLDLSSSSFSFDLVLVSRIMQAPSPVHLPRVIVSITQKMFLTVAFS